MAPRQRHPNKDLERLLQDAEDRNWRITKGNGYYMAWCPCPDKHKATVHLTPRRDYPKNRRRLFEKFPCWEEETP